MENKHKKYFSLIVYAYILSSFLATLLLFGMPKGALILYTVGASSGYIAFGVATLDVALWASLRIAAMLWAVLFPIALVILFISFLKKKYKPICYAMIADTVVVIAWVVFAYATGNIYGAQVFLPDLFVSLGCSFVAVWQYKKMSK